MRQRDIAIIGIGCRYPGGATTPDQFWDFLERGGDGIVEVPPDRWAVESYYDPRPGTPGKTIARRGGFIAGIDRFDADFFGISPREAELMDPQQRLLLETAWEALEDGGVQIDREGEETGVFVGISTNDYSLLQSGIDELRTIDVYTTTGTVMSIAANRLSHALDLRGPSVAVDTACSSSLVAVHLAVRALRDGDCKVALAGGVNALLLPTPFIAFSRMSMLSSDGRCKAFDDRADGFVRGEGVGVVALELLSDALAKGRRIYAVIRGTASNQDGHTNGLTVPSPRAQASLVRRACRDADVAPSAVSYMEAHGTGTPVGDPIEATALGQSVGQMRPADSPLLIGSVKTNIGHLEAGAGVAGVIKAALSLSHGRVPPSLHYRKPTPHVDFADLNLAVVTETTPFASLPALVGVNSFGFGGSNAHAILESPPEVAERQAARDVGAILLPLSARTGERFAAVAAKWRAFLAPGGEGAALDIADVAHSAATRRNHRGERLAIVARDREHLLEQLAAVAGGATPAGVVTGRPADKAPRPVFVYSGQGTQWWAMGRELLASDPVFRAVIERCDALFSKLGDWSLIEELTRDERTSRLHVTAISQPAIFAIQAALTELWASWGIRPVATVGHSVGEVAAAWAGGILTLEDAARVIFHRGRCMESAPTRGRMIAAAVTEAEARRLIAPYGDRVSLGAVNSPALVTLSGESEPLEAIAAELAARGVFTRFLDVQYAFHSAQMDPVKDDLLAALGHVPLQPARIPVISTVTASEAGRRDYGTEYWWLNVRRTVLFGPAVQHLIETGFNNFLEVGAHPALASALAECLREEGVKGTVLGSLRRKESDRVTMLASLGALHVAGHPIEWDGVLGGARNAVALPRETWQRERFWRESAGAFANRMTQRVHPLLERALKMAEPAFESELDQNALPWLADHRVQGHVVFPAAGSIEMMLGAARTLLGGEGGIVEDVDFRKALIVADGENPTKVQIRYRPADGVVEVASRDDAGEWSLNAIGAVRIPDGGGEAGQIDIAAVRRGLPEEIAGQEIAARFVENGISYGPAFRGIETVWRRDGEALGRVGVAEPIVGQPEHYLAHPALFDACLQVISAALPRDAALSRGPFLPVHVDRIRLRSPFRGPVWTHVQMRFAAGRAIVADLRIVDDSGRVLMEIDGFRCQAVTRQTSQSSASLEDWLYANTWQASPRPGAAIGKGAALAPTEAAAEAAAELARAHSTDDQSVSRDVDRATALQDLATGWIVEALRALGWGLRTGHRSTLDALRTRLAIAPVHHRMFDRFLKFLAADGVLRLEGDSVTVVRAPAKRDPERLWTAVLLRHPILLTELTLIRRSGVRLVGMLRGEIDPLSVLFPDGSAGTLEHFYQSGWSQLPFNLIAAEAVAAAVSGLPAGRALRVLEVGAGTGGLTAHILPRLPADRTRYVFTDASNAFFSKAEQAFFDYRFMEFAPLDIERSGTEQGFAPASFDIVIASNVLHATRDLGETMDHVRELLAPRGMFVGIEINDTPRWVDLVFGLTAGWWRFADDIRSDHAGIRADEWKQLFAARGFEEAHALTLSASLAGQAVLIARRPAEQPAAAMPQAVNAAAEPAPPWLLYGEGEGLAEGMAALLARSGRAAVTAWPGNTYRRLSETSYEVRRDAPGDLRRLLAELVAAGRAPAVAVHLSTLDVAEPDATTAGLVDAEKACASLMHLVQALTAEGIPQSRLIVVTRGLQAIEGTDSPLLLAGAPAWGFTRVVVNEHRGLDPLLIDLDPTGSAGDAAEILAEFESGLPEREVAFRAGARFVNRVIHTSFEKLARPADATDGRSGYRLEIPAPGVLDRLALMERPRRAPGPGEVEIAVKAAALNFRDVMKALGIYPTESANDDLPGDECSGTIAAVGEGVKGLAVGDAVVAIGGGCIASHVTLPAALVFRMPARLTFDEAVTVPVPFLTAWHALHEIGRIRKGETVLLHAATGGVGLAALQVAKAADARVFATAGSPEKRDLLRALGVGHVMDSRTLAFADEIRAVTDGRGVDIVLNSLSGRAIEKSLSILAMGGRFLEIGKRDIFQNSRIGMRPFRNNVSLQAIDLRQVMDERPDLVAREMREVIKRIEDGRYNPLPYRSFPMDRVVDAFRYMARARHIGKVIVGTGNGHVAAQPAADPRPPELAADATYMIVGGLGGFGLSVAEWLAERGARHIVLTGRRGATAESRSTLDALRARGIEVVAEAADVTKREDVDRVFDRVEREMPPLKGILHAAMVLDDGLIAQLDEARLARVMAPKVLGGWHLHQRSLRLDLDFFILFSSISELVGNAGQANYVAANSFLVSLANYRRRLGLPALAIAWGRISGAGYVDRNAETAERLDRIGMEGVPATRATEAIGRLLTANAAHVGVLRMDWQAWARAAGGQLPPRLAGLAEASVETSDAASQGLREIVLAAAEAERPALLVAMLREQVAKVLRSSSADLDPDRPLSELGLDSLMAIDLLHRIENAFGVAVPTGRVGSEVSVTILAGTLLELITGTASKPAAAKGNGNGRPHANDDAPDECILPLRTAGDRPPLYLFHAAGGLATVYSRLVAALPADLPAVGLQSRAIDSDRAEFPTMEAMGGAYAGLLSRRQPDGPLHLVGFSWGGYAALATAAALEEAGRDVAHVTLLDSDPLWIDPSRSADERGRAIMKQISGSLFRDLGLVANADDPELARSTDTLVDLLLSASEAERAEQVTAWVEAAGGAANGPSSERVERFVRLFFRHVAMMDGHRPRGLRASILSLRARGEGGRSTLKGLTTGAFTEDVLDCSHYEILQPPIVETVAALVNEALLSANGTDGDLALAVRQRGRGDRPPLQVLG